MVEKETIEAAWSVVKEIGTKVGESGEVVMGWYAHRAPYELVDPFMGLLGILIGIGCFAITKKAYAYMIKMGSDYEAPIPVMIGTGIAGTIAVVAGVAQFFNTLKPAMMAIASPEIYALEQIAKLATSL